LWLAMMKFCSFACMCVFRPSIDALLFIYASLTYGPAYSLFSGLPSATTQVSRHFFAVLGHVLISFRTCTSHKSTRLLALRNIYRRS
jgi:hypothetical protein